MPSTQVNDINMYYELHGTGYPLVLIAGFSCNYLFWLPLVSSLADHFQVLIFDHRGCGRTDTTKGPYTIKMLADDAAGLMKTLGIENAYILGHSMGGAVLQQICFETPQIVRKGMLCASLAKIPDKTMLQIEAQIQLEKAGASSESLIMNTLPWLYSNQYLQNKDHVQSILWKMLHNPYPQSREGFLAQAEALRTFDSSSYLKHIKTPLMIIAGNEDPLTPLSCSEYLLKKIPHAKLHVFEGQSHLFIEEKGSEVASLINAFFKK